MNQKQPKKSGLLLWVLIAAAAVFIAAVLLWPTQTEAPVRPSAQSTGPTGTEPAITAPAQMGPTETEPEAQDPDGEQSIINLGYGLEITDAGGYTGAYMEDGSNEVVSGVMMLVVRNAGEEDVQLADITALCGGTEYTFRLTNLAAGERAVLLDLGRKQAADLEYATLSSVALFGEPMALHEDAIQISGLKGMMNVQNISGADMEGDIYIYYKFAAQDIFYGGITFRVRVEGGLKAGEIRQIPAGHYSPEGCSIVQVTIHE